MSASFTLPAAAAEGFKDAKAYDAHRPSYPPEAMETLLRNLKIVDQPNVNIVEIAAGTGKFTELLAGRHESYNIMAVEPHAGMREQLVAKKLRGVTAVDGQFVHARGRLDGRALTNPTNFKQCCPDARG